MEALLDTAYGMLLLLKGSIKRIYPPHPLANQSQPLWAQQVALFKLFTMSVCKASPFEAGWIATVLVHALQK